MCSTQARRRAGPISPGGLLQDQLVEREVGDGLSQALVLISLQLLHALAQDFAISKSGEIVLGAAAGGALAGAPAGAWLNHKSSGHLESSPGTGHTVTSAPKDEKNLRSN